MKQSAADKLEALFGPDFHFYWVTPGLEEQPLSATKALKLVRGPYSWRKIYRNGEWCVMFVPDLGTKLLLCKKYPDDDPRYYERGDLRARTQEIR